MRIPRRILVAIATTLALGACSTPEEAPDAAEAAEDRATPVEVVVADPGFFEDTIELTGTVSADNDASLSPDVGGTLTFVADVGTFIRAGQTIAQVRASTQQAGVASARAQAAQGRAGVSQAQAQVAGAEAGVRAARAQREAAQAQLDLAQDQYRRQYPLYRDSILSALEFRQVESQVAQARAQVAQADAGIAQAQGQLSASREGVQAARAQSQAGDAGVASAQSQLASTRVVAPFSGVVEARLAEPGELAAPGQPVVRLVGAGNVRVEAGVPERYANEIAQGTQVQVTPNAYEAEARGGRVAFVGTAIDDASRTFPIEVAVENSDRTLKPSMVVRLAVTRRVIEDAIVVPTEAVVRDERGTSVFVVDGGQARRVVVSLGPDAGDRVVLASGVERGQQIIVSGAGELADGEPVRVTGTRSGPVASATSGARPAPSPRTAATLREE